MYKYKTPTKTSISRNKSFEGETIEQKVRRVVNNKEPITDGAPIIFTERKEGVVADYNPRTDKWEAGVDATDKLTATFRTKREEGIKKQTMGEEAYNAMKAEEAKNSDKPKS